MDEDPRSVALICDIPTFRKEVFDDIVGARLWLTSATAYCSPGLRRTMLIDAMKALETFATKLLQGDAIEIVDDADPSGPELTGAMLWRMEYREALETSYKSVFDCAHDDLRDAYM